MLTYNAFLYTERQKRELSRRKMAKLLHIGHFSYKMIESGYFKPTKKQIKKISEALDVDYSIYFEGELSYPAELPEKKRNKLVALFYKVLGHIAFRITFIVLTTLSVGFLIYGVAAEKYYESHIKMCFNDEMIAFAERIQDNGTIHLYALDKLIRPEYYTYEQDAIEGTSKYISIVGYYEDELMFNIDFNATYRSDKGRLIYSIEPNIKDGHKNYTIEAKYSRYEDAINFSTSFEGYGDEYKNGDIDLQDSRGIRHFYSEDDAQYAELIGILREKLTTFEQDFNDLLSEKDPSFAMETSEKFFHLAEIYYEGKMKGFVPTIIAFAGKYGGIILSGINLFITIFAFLYGTKKGVEVNYRPAKLDVAVDDIKRMKADMKLSPFIPETLIEIIGILLVFIGSFRVVFYVASFLVGHLSTSLNSSTGTNYMQVFMVGMFLLYFIDFDIFLDDKRVFRNIFLYSIIFFCLYALENLLLRTITNSYAIGSLVQRVPLPNMFGSITCYYLIMFFLFFTPKRIKKKSTLILYRCCAAIPGIVIIAFWFIYNGYNVLYTANWPLEFKNLFNGEKIPFSLLAISYLYGLYFLRLFFERKYGLDRARVFFNGNKFLWIKNIMVCLIILIIGVVELMLRNNATAHKLGLGMYWNILLLIPLLLFYHPHKGPRNLALDWTTLFLYILAISISYFIVVFLVLLSL